jgi:hypothetical protein
MSSARIFERIDLFSYCLMPLKVVLIGVLLGYRIPTSSSSYNSNINLISQPTDCASFIGTSGSWNPLSSL